MNGVIEFANPQVGRYGVRTESDGYTLVRMLELDVMLDAGNEVEGDLGAPTVQTYHVRGLRNVTIFAERTHVPRSTAEGWVGKRLDR